MMRHPRLIAIVTLLMITAAAWWLDAAPSKPADFELPQEVMTLRGIKAIRIQVTPVTAYLDVEGATMEMVEEALAERLTELGYEVVDDPKAPKLLVRPYECLSDDLPTGVGLNLVIGVHQEITVHRLEKKMTVPTTVLTHSVLTTKGQVARVLKETTEDLAGRFAQLVRLADANP